MERKINADDIVVPPGYIIEPAYTQVNVPTAVAFSEDGTVFLTDAGMTDGNGKVLVLRDGKFDILAQGFKPPLVGITYHGRRLYIAHRGRVTVMKPSGQREDIVTGLPSFGDHENNPIVVGPDGKLYFGQGTATNSGIVGPDNRWLADNPYFHDHAGATIQLTGLNFASKNILTPASDEIVETGAFVPYGVATAKGQWVPGVVRASGSILRVNKDGSELEQVAWGLRNPFGLQFDPTGRLWTINNGMDERGSRPVANCPDEFHEILPGTWYGWPDYAAGEPVTQPWFESDGFKPSFLFAGHPMIPPRPFACFAPHTAAAGFVFSHSHHFGHVGDAFIAELGSEAPATTGGKPAPKVGHRVSRLQMRDGELHAFAQNRSQLPASRDGGGGLERPMNVCFGPDNTLYIIDIGILRVGRGFEKHTGVVWRMRRRS
ncbi:PQQ-dependent sugar dehydrogenase [Alicyclobacillus dauci]|uniref:PQQ-dependent sugar dehydrogenase n=1 Tax=Alicyclobacillus dauci TaxID=1475485 RepID=A0ABY6Z6D9_9BACL|nr:PQQ-dependent sugar dehydrogenase [Alicyclobacillus dauci]WAH37851.1 PQQ-dependent sugar dehydrogenase [Alicyclobacillus dauci]